MRRALVVDDQSEVRYTVCRMLEASGYVVREAADGAEALTALGHELPDVMLIDLAMPALNGLHLLNRLQCRRDWACIPKIVMTGALTSEPDVQELGACALMRKPFTRGQLIATVQVVLRRGSAPAPQSENGQGKKQRSSPCILVVEDDPDARHMLETMLRLEGYTTMTANNGQEALDRMRARRPCAVLLDLMMPVMDGWQFRRQQLKEPALASVPVVCITAVGNPGDVESLLGVPCLRKPIDVDVVLKAVEQRCRPAAH